MGNPHSQLCAAVLLAHQGGFVGAGSSSCLLAGTPLRDAVSLTRAPGTLGYGNFQGKPKARSQVGVLTHLVMFSFCQRGYFSNALPT